MGVSEAAFLPEGGKARRVYLLLRDEIMSGRVPSQSLLPGEQHLARMHNVSRVTIRRALDALSADGLIEKRPGAGSVVVGAVRRSAIAADMSTLIPQIVQMGQSTTARLLSFTYGRPPSLVRDALKLAETDSVQIATRVRLFDGKPFSHLTTYVPEELALQYSEQDLATTPLFELLERGGVSVTSASQSVTATLAAPDAADALEVAVGSALLSLTRVIRDENGRGAEYLSALYRPDMFRLEMDLEHVGRGGNRHWEPIIGAVK